MNIFFLDKDPTIAAQAHCDKHCVKMVLETAQLLSTAHRVLDGNEYADSAGLYRSTHKNHPSAIWVRSTDKNYLWTTTLFDALCTEYAVRWHRVHKSARMSTHLSKLPQNISVGLLTDPPQCMPDHCKASDTVTAYRNYYYNEKARFAEWRHSTPPAWWGVR